MTYLETVEKCEKCGGKMYKVGDKDNYNTHCWNCDNEDTVVTVNF